MQIALRARSECRGRAGPGGGAASEESQEPARNVYPQGLPTRPPAAPLHCIQSLRRAAAPAPLAWPRSARRARARLLLRSGVVGGARARPAPKGGHCSSSKVGPAAIGRESKSWRLRVDMRHAASRPSARPRTVARRCASLHQACTELYTVRACGLCCRGAHGGVRAYLYNHGHGERVCQQAIRGAVPDQQVIYGAVGCSGAFCYI
jgi:hypothetical protein